MSLTCVLGSAEEGVRVGVGDVVGAAERVPLVLVHGHSADVVQTNDFLNLFSCAGAVVEHLDLRVGLLQAAHVLRVVVGASVGGARRFVETGVVAGFVGLVAFASAQMLQLRICASENKIR